MLRKHSLLLQRASLNAAQLTLIASNMGISRSSDRLGPENPEGGHGIQSDIYSGETLHLLVDFPEEVLSKAVADKLELQQ